jgi:Immunoglobulin-like domain of bacterial spore germination
MTVPRRIEEVFRMSAVRPPVDDRAPELDAPTEPLPPVSASGPTPGRRRWWLVALRALTALVLTVATVFVIQFVRQGQSGPTGTPAGGPTPTAQSGGQPSGQPSVEPTTPPSPTPGGDSELVAIARAFAVEVVGMTHPVAGAARATGADTAAVDVRPIAPNGQPLASAVTTVLLRRSGASWTATGTVCDTIRVDVPSAGQLVSTPLAVSGQALAYEGTVVVRVLEPAGGKLVEVGRGVVTGGGDVLRPFHGDVTFRQPGGGVGWVVFFEESAVDGQVLRATTVTVSFPVRS